MARGINVGSWLFGISDNQKELLRRTNGSATYSHLWSAPNGGRILDISARGDDVIINTDRHTYIRTKSGNVNLY